MCGIFGIFATGGQALRISPDQALAALDLLRHRGPDARRLCLFPQEGTPVFREAPAQGAPSALSGLLGHTRLSIIDRSAAGLQPMSLGAPGRYWISYNGEIYNYRELRQELLARGVSFQSQTDTEVLLALYAHQGPAMLERLNGMFALAIWDAQEGTLFLARDRHGIKPLYTTRLPDGAFAFASEIKSLLALRPERALDPLTLFEHLTFQNHFGEKTLAQGVELLPPGHWMSLNARSGDCQRARYWEPVFEPAAFNPNRLPALAGELRELLERAVSRQLVGEATIGSFLSGGMDTGAITALAIRQRPGLATYTAGFDTRALDGRDPLEAHFDERPEARALAERFGTDHREMLIAPEALANVFPRVVWHLDDFRVGISYQNYLVSRLVGDSSTVVLSGAGGDELLAGYPWRYAPVLDLQDPVAFEAQYYRRWVRFLDDGRKRELLSPAMRQAVGDYSTRDAFSRVLQGCRADDPLNRALCFDMKTFLHGLLLVEDRLSMAHGVESRVPFLDNDLVDFCLSLPPQAKLHPSPDGGEPVAKWLLKQALQGILPEPVLLRRKQGFTPPDASWYRGTLRPFVLDLLVSEQSLARGIFQPDGLRRLVAAHMAGDANHRFLLWSLMCLEQWQRLFIDPPRIQPPEAAHENTGPAEGGPGVWRSAV